MHAFIASCIPRLRQEAGGLRQWRRLQAQATPGHPVMQHLAADPPHARDFWLRLLHVDPGMRLTVEAALEHPFLQS